MADSTLSVSVKRLLIQAYDNPKCTGTVQNSIEAFINPESFTNTYSVQYNPSNEPGSSANTAIFSKIAPAEFKFKLIVDGTGIVAPYDPKYKSVDAYLADFRATTYDYVSSIHRPYYLRLSWGKIMVTAVLKSYTLTYSLFKPDGTALRASIDAQFTESIDYSDKTNMASRNSPDLTHFRTVKAGDTLPLMAYKIYGDSSYYLQVAKSNGLNSIYGINPGDSITFDPLEKLPQ
jgi:nucleoid-associated protein YgaU